MERLSIDKYFMQIAQTVALRSTCIKRQVGCVITLDKEIVSTGYNGAVKGAKHCIDIYDECPRKEIGAHRGERYDLCPALRAEANAIIQAAKTSKSINGGTAYITIAPCITCIRMLINAGINRLVMGDRPQQEVLDLIKDLNWGASFSEIDGGFYEINFDWS